MRSSDFEFKQIKSEFKEKYFKLPFHDAKISNTLNHLTLILIVSSFSLLVALITSIIIKQETYITTYSLLYVFLSLFTLFIFLTIERRNLFSIVLSIWKSLYDIELLNKALINKLELLVFVFSWKKYWFTWLVTLLIWSLLLIITFLIGYWMKLH
ncbi:MAG: hypothetical protein IIT78_00675 [Mycoplasmataceae bacterium]|nr:hypothetical protein [Mycoplasmataceae bacterium]